MSDYNGWTNRETWLVNVWYDICDADAVDDVKELLEHELSYMSNGVLKDMIDLSLIDWDELREAVKDEYCTCSRKGK